MTENLLNIPDEGRVSILLTTVERLEKQKQRFLMDLIREGNRVKQYGEWMQEQVKVKQEVRELLSTIAALEGDSEEQLAKVKDIVEKALDLLCSL